MDDFGPMKNAKVNLKIFLIYLIHQMIVFGSIYLNHTLYAPKGSPKGLRVIWPLLANWDGEWYLKIVAEGYNAHSAAFFPLYPLLIWLLKACGLKPLAAGLIISNLCLLGICFLFFKLVSKDYDETVSLKALWYLMLFPTSFFLNLVYTEALFLIFVLISFYNARQGHWLLAGIGGLLAAATRNWGIFIIIPLIGEYFNQINFNWRLLKGQILWLGIIPIGLLSYMFFLQNHFADPFLFVRAQTSWLRFFSLPWEAFLITIRNIVNDSYWGRNFLDLLITVVAMGMFIIGLPKKIRFSYLLYGVIGFLIPLFVASPRAGLFSMPRFVMVLFPIYLCTAVGFNRPELERGTTALFAGALAHFSVLFSQLRWIA